MTLSVAWPIFYRLVSTLSCLSKSCLYTPLQFPCMTPSGFRPGDSTVMQLVYIVQEIYEALEKGNEIKAVFLDISKAFDRVQHRDLLAKLRSFGLEGNMMDWFGGPIDYK